MRARILLPFLLAFALAAVAGAATAEGEASDMLPFHAEAAIPQYQQVPIPAGRCTDPLPPGLSYLWLTKGNGTHTSTHLGTGPFHVELCVYGLLTNPGAPPSANGIPVGFHAELTFTAANGDQLLVAGRLIGFTVPPPTPGWQIIESLTFLDGGTGRFEFAAGTGQGLIEGTGATAVYDGWIRYGKTDK